MITLQVSTRADFCVGYFNLRGWKQISQEIEHIPGGMVFEEQESIARHCRLLVGMQKNPIETLRFQYLHEEEIPIDQAEVAKLKKKLAQDFREQLTIGVPSSADEAALRQLSHQMGLIQEDCLSSRHLNEI